MKGREVSAALGQWDKGVRSAVPLEGGWNSAVWLVRAADGTRWVAKLADAEAAASFRSGLRVARRAGDRGFRSGPPVPLPDGSLEVTVPGGVLALLEYVDGRPVEPRSAADLRRMGGALARAHASVASDLDCLDPDLVWPWPWADDALLSIPMPVEVRDAAAHALDDARKVTDAAGLPVQVVHGDPALDAVVLDEVRAEADGVIDWSAAMGAPALYDLGTVTALQWRHPGRTAAVLQGYTDVRPGIVDGLRLLDTFVRLRWMCTALYFADRIARGITRGGAPHANAYGLTEAQFHLSRDR